MYHVMIDYDLEVFFDVVEEKRCDLNPRIESLVQGIPAERRFTFAQICVIPICKDSNGGHIYAF